MDIQVVSFITVLLPTHVSQALLEAGPPIIAHQWKIACLDFYRLPHMCNFLKGYICMFPTPSSLPCMWRDCHRFIIEPSVSSVHFLMALYWKWKAPDVLEQGNQFLSVWPEGLQYVWLIGVQYKWYWEDKVVTWTQWIRSPTFANHETWPFWISVWHEISMGLTHSSRVQKGHWNCINV